VPRAPIATDGLTAAVRRGLLAGAAVVALATLAGVYGVYGGGSAGLAPPPAPALAPALVKQADFGTAVASGEARQLADWIAAVNDNHGAPFVVVDKKQAKLFVFDGGATLQGSTPVLLGQAVGDDTVDGIGSRPVADVLPFERTTPAGRFIGERGRNTSGYDVVWVDYDAAVSMHRVVTNRPEERRLQRLESPAVDDNRISYGCINVPIVFYESHIRPTFAAQRAIIYVMPEHKSLQQVFGPLDTAAQPRLAGLTGL